MVDIREEIMSRLCVIARSSLKRGGEGVSVVEEVMLKHAFGENFEIFAVLFLFKSFKLKPSFLSAIQSVILLIIISLAR